MKKQVKYGMAAAALLMMAVPAHADESVMSKFHVDFYGFIKGEYAYNARNLGNTSPAMSNNKTAPATAGLADQSVLTARQSRFGFKVTGPTLLGGGKTSALLEADFYGANNGNESPTLRMRQAWGAIDWSSTQLLFGQAYDTFGPYIKPTIDFGAGATTGAPNNPRVPMFRLTQKVDINRDNQLSFVVALQNPSQDSGTDLGGVPAAVAPATGNFNSAVNVAGQINFTSKALGVAPGYMGMGMKPLTLGLFGLYGNQKVKATVTKQLDSYGSGIYAYVPILRSQDGKGRAMSLAFEGQGYLATDMAWSGATASAGVVTATDAQERKGFGLAGSFTFYPTQDLGLNLGYGRRGVINPGKYAATNELYNQELFANLTYDLNAAVRVGAEFQHMDTQYKGAPNYMGINNIGRLAFYYFF